MADFCVIVIKTTHRSSASSLKVTEFHKVKKSEKYKWEEQKLKYHRSGQN